MRSSMPVTVLWGRSPKSQDSLVKALLADAWASVGPLRQLLIILLHGRQTHVTFGEPISLRRLIDEETDEATAVRKANRFLRFYFRRMRESSIGPDLSHRRNLIQAMVTSAALQEAIAEESARLRVSTEAAEGRARKFAWEIASDFSYPVVRAMELLLARLWGRLYGGSTSTMERSSPRSRPARGSSTCPTIAATSITCCSRTSSTRRGSHRRTSPRAPTSISRSWVRSCGAAAPSSCAGASRASRCTRRCSREYLHAMLAKGFPIAYFIEGGRSRAAGARSRRRAACSA